MIAPDTFDKTVHSLGSGKALGPYGIPNKMVKFLPNATRSALFSLFSLLAHKAYAPPDWCHNTTCLLHKEGDPTFLDNYRPIALMNNMFKLWTALIKDVSSKYAEPHGILIEQQDGFRLQRGIHGALASIIMMMEDAKTCNKDVCIMYDDFKGAFNAAYRSIMSKHMRQFGMPSTFVDTCEQVYDVSTTDYITMYGPTPSIDSNRGTLQGDTFSPFLFTLFLEPSLRWLTVGSKGYHPGAPSTRSDPTEPTATYPGHGFADGLSLAMGSPTT
jgi:DNA-binding FrmR family transcriptional regulator